MGFKFNIFTGTFDLVDAGTTTWLTPVANRAALPSGDVDGAARVVLDEDTVFVYDNGADTWHNTRLNPSEFSAVANAAGVSIGSNTAAGAPNITDYKVVLHAADATNPGGVSTTAQSFAGIKTFVNQVLISDTTDATSKDTGALVIEGGVGIEKNLHVGGNFQVDGTTTFVNSTNLEVTDNNFVVNKGGNDASADGAGMTVERTGTDGSLVYQDSLASKWKAGQVGSEVELANVSSTQTLENKTIDGTTATGNNTVTIDAADATYDNATSGLAATDAQAAIDEVEGRLDTAESDILTKADRDLSNLTSPTAVNQDLIMTGSKTLVLENDVPVRSRNNADTLDINLLKLDTSDRAVLGSGANIILDGANVLPSSNGANLGGGGAAWDIVVNQILTSLEWANNNATLKTPDDTATNQMVMITGTASAGTSGSIDLTTGPATGGVSGNVCLETGTSNDTITGNIDLQTGDNTSTGDSGKVLIETGTAAGGTSGNVELVTGTGGTRGNIKLKDGSEGTLGQVWTSTDADGSGNWSAVPADSNKADIDLNNLASTAINTDLTFASGTPGTLATANNGAGDSEDLTIKTGTASGTRGNIILDAPDVQIPGKLTVTGGIDPAYLQLDPQAGDGGIPNNSIYVDSNDANKFKFKDNGGVSFSVGSGDVIGPASATDNVLVRYDGVTGKLIQTTGLSVDDSDKIIGATEITTQGTRFANNTSLSVNGTNGNYIKVTNSATFQQTSNISAAVWFKTTDLNTAFGGIFTHYFHPSSRRKWSISMTNGKVDYRVSPDGGGASGKTYQSTSNYNDGNWHLAAFSFTNDTFRVYLDGVELTTGAGTLNLVNDPTVTNLYNNTLDDLTIGALADNVGGSFTFIGEVDEPTYWNKVLSPAEITELYNSGKVFDYSTHSANANLVEWWRFDGDTLPTVVAQVTSPANDGAEVGSVSLVSSAPPGTGDLIISTEDQTGSEDSGNITIKAGMVNTGTRGTVTLEGSDIIIPGKLTVGGGIDPEYLQLDPQANDSGVPNNSIWVDSSDSYKFKFKDNVGSSSEVGGGAVDSVNSQTGVVVLDADDISDAATTNKYATQAQLDKVDYITVTQAVDLDTIESDTATNNAKVSADGSVTSHSDVTDAGSGAIITAQERIDIGTAVQPGDDLTSSELMSQGDVYSNISSFNFTGTSGDAIDVTDDSLYQQTANISYFTWTKASNITAFNCMASHSDFTSGANRRWYIYHNGNGEFTVLVSQAGSSVTNAKQYKTNYAIDDGKWHHVGFTFAANDLKLYVDGAEVTGGDLNKLTDNVCNTLNNNVNIVQLSIGELDAGSTYPYIGQLDEPTYWDKVLSAAEVAELYNNGKIFDYTTHSANANLVSWWRGDGDTLPTITDVVNSKNGTAAGNVSLSSDTPLGNGELLVASEDKDVNEDSGNVIVKAGTVSGTGTRGAIKLQDGSEGASGHVWTSKGVNGEGNWEPAAADLSLIPAFENLGLSANSFASALTVAIRQKDGSTNPGTGEDKVVIPFRSSTLGSGEWVKREVTSFRNISIEIGATLNHVSGEDCLIYVYAIDNAGTVEVAVTSRKKDESILHNTTAMSASADGDALYTDVARTNVPIRFLGVMTSNQTTAGQWDSVPSKIALEFTKPLREEYHSKALGQIPTGTLGAAWNKVTFGTMSQDPLGLYNTSTGQWTAPRDGLIQVNVAIDISHNAGTGRNFVRVRDVTDGVDACVGVDTLRSSDTASYVHASGQLFVRAGRKLEIQTYFTMTGGSYGNVVAGSSFSIGYVDY